MNAYRWTILLSASLLGAVFAAGAEDEPEETQDLKIWTPTELVEKGGDVRWDNVTRFVVEFRVASIRMVPTIYPDGEKREVPHLVPSDDFPGKDSFTVPIEKEMEEALEGLGVRDLKRYFEGKTIRVKGKVTATGLNLVIESETRWTYHVSLRSLDQLLRVEPVPKTQNP